MHCIPCTAFVVIHNYFICGKMINLNPDHLYILSSKEKDNGDMSIVLTWQHLTIYLHMDSIHSVFIY